MRLPLTILLIAICAALAEYFLPWWSIAPVSFIIASLMRLPPAKAFLSGFLGIALLWLLVIVWRDIPNEHILSSRMAILFFQKPNYILFSLVTTLVGGLVGGMAAWAAAFFRTKPLPANYNKV